MPKFILTKSYSNIIMLSEQCEILSTSLDSEEFTPIPGTPQTLSVCCDGASKRKITSNVDATGSTLLISDVSFVSDCSDSCRLDALDINELNKEFQSFRLNYLIVHIAIMLADGLQGTHLYVLYEAYNFNVATLYATGFAAGALASPFMGPLVDRIGRRKSAVLYCLLEIMINSLEQYECLAGLFLSRIVGGITTNLLFTVFESWLVTEHRKKGFSEDKLEIILRDSVISSNVSAIASGFLAHQLAEYFGPVGPFEGAVFFTFIALLLVCTQWTENYGSDSLEAKTVGKYMEEAFSTITGSRNITKIGLIQGLSEGALMTFVFLWSPALAEFSSQIPKDASVLGLDSGGEPAYGLIFGGFMACGAIGGYFEPQIRAILHRFLFRQSLDCNILKDCDVSDDMSDDDLSSLGDECKPIVEILASVCYFLAAILLSVPFFLSGGPGSFSLCLVSFFLYEFLVGVYMPCEGVIRSVYMPNDSICSLMTMLRVIVNVVVALGVISTNFIPVKQVFAFLSLALLVAFGLQISMVDKDEWCVLRQDIYDAWKGILSLFPIDRKSDETEIDRLFTEKKAVINRRDTLVTECSSLSMSEESMTTDPSIKKSGLRKRIIFS